MIVLRRALPKDETETFDTATEALTWLGGTKGSVIVVIDGGHKSGAVSTSGPAYAMRELLEVIARAEVQS